MEGNRIVTGHMDRAVDYEERDVKAAYSVLIEIGQVLGAYREKFVIVGGSVPWLLLPAARPKHIGTLDIDINLNPELLSGGGYASLVETLEQRGYERGQEGQNPFQLRRWVNVDKEYRVPVLVDLLMPREAKRERHKQKLVEGLRVQEVDGGMIALHHNVGRTLDGRMPDGRQNQVDVLVATIPALLVMKGYALVGRDKKKDSYDIYFSILNYEGGLAVLAEDCRKLLDDPIVLKGYRHIADKFRHRDDFGPATVRQFLEESDAAGEMTPDQVQTDAFGQVSAFIRALNISDGNPVR